MTFEIKILEKEKKRGGKMDSLEDIRVRAGTIIGSEHQRRQINNQDSYDAKRMGNQYIWGIVCDGCGSGLRSEAGAHFLSNYLNSKIPYFINSGSTIQEIPDQLFIAGLGYLSSLASDRAMIGIPEVIKFIKDHLLCTVLGFIMDKKECVFFNAGDGVIVINNEAFRIDQNNAPLYMAYHLLDKATLRDLSAPFPLKFGTWTINVSYFDKFAICSDGIEESIIDELWGFDHSLGLQRKLRILRQEKKALFSDDCTVITVEKTNS